VVQKGSFLVFAGCRIYRVAAEAFRWSAAYRFRTSRCVWPKIRFIPVDPMTLRLIAEYLEMLAKHGGGLEGEDKDVDGSLFRPVKNKRTGTLDKHNIVTKYARDTGSAQRP
jgi:hypothetical protein